MANKGNGIPGDLRPLDGNRDGQRYQILHQRVEGGGDDAGLARPAGSNQGHSFIATERSGQSLLTSARAGHGVERDVGGVQLLVSGRWIEGATVMQDLQILDGHEGPPARGSLMGSMKSDAGVSP